MSGFFSHNTIFSCFSMSFLFMTEWCVIIWAHYILFIHLSLNGIWAVSTFWLLLIVLLRTFMYRLSFEYPSCFHFSSFVYTSEWNCRVILYLTYWEICHLFFCTACKLKVVFMFLNCCRYMLRHSHALPFQCYLWLHSHYSSIVEWLWQRSYRLQSRKYLSFTCLQKRFDDLCSIDSLLLLPLLL